MKIISFENDAINKREGGIAFLLHLQKEVYRKVR